MKVSNDGLILVCTCALVAGVCVAAPKDDDRGTAEARTASPTKLLAGVYDPLPERMDDPPAPAEVIGRQTSSAGAIVTFGRYASVQVNVNALGNNIVGDAANEPTIAINPQNPKQIAIAWRQFDTVASNFREAGRAYSADGGESWTFPGVIDPERFRSDPVLGFDAFGNFYYSSLTQSVAGFEVTVFKSTDGGVTWPQAVYAFGGDKQWMVADDRSTGLGAGHIYQSWNMQFSCCAPTDFTRSINAGGAFESPLSLPDPRMKWGTLDTDSNGVLYLGGASLDQSGHLFTRSLDARDPTVTPSFEAIRPVDLGGFTGGFGGFAGPNPMGLLGQVWTASHPGKPGHVFMLSSVVRSSDPTEVMFVRSVNGGQTWTAPVRVNDDDEGNNAWQWFGTLAVAPNGRVDAAWNDTRNTGDAKLSALFYAYSMDEGQTWSGNEQVSPVFNSHVGFPNQAKIGDYYHMISDNGGANLAYAATFNGEQDVYFVRIAQDCNHNGVDDDCDTLCGAEGTRCDAAGCGQRPDCNGNRVPDECEPNEDCNSNKVRDICEIGAQPALDCNSNRTLDSCEDTSDCNENTVLDFCDLLVHGDCNRNDTPDDCDIADKTSTDHNGDGVPDDCQGSCCDCVGCAVTAESECRFANGVFGGLGTMCGQEDSCRSPVFEHDDCSLALGIPSAPRFRGVFDNRCTSTDGPTPPLCEPFGSDLWYTYTVPCSGTLRFSTCEVTDFDAILAVYGSGNTCFCPSDNASLQSCGDDTCGFGGGPAFVDLPVTAGRCYTVRVGGFGSSTGDGELTLEYLTTCRPMDLNRDGQVDMADFAILQNCFGPVGPGCEDADFDGDGVTDVRDYRVFFAVLGG